MTIKDGDVAVIGMSCRFPGANSVAQFWDNLCAGRESIRALSDEQLRSAGVAAADIDAGTYVKVSAMLDDVDRFDAGFFRISPLEAELMDPQLRLLLQCAWETLEDAGYAADGPQNIGVFAGSGGVTSSYFSHFVNVNRRFEKITASATQLGNDKDFLSTYLSYKLNLTGPSLTVQTACSTSMVALHQARMSLLSAECDMALAGGVSIRVPHGHGYHYKEGFIFSRSGRMRAFDAGADGVVFGSGLGLVLLKRLAAAIADGDHIYAVVKGSAIANDGRQKMSYAASSARGQIACIGNALKNARVDAGSIGFVESHGTGTAMGDPEEIRALSAAFKAHGDRKGYCGLGAVKTNVGHLDMASGIASFIKAALVVKHGVLPPTLHYTKPNPRIRFENTPFYINTALQKWSEDNAPRRAAVNSLGVGGTNAFVILEQHVPQERAAASVPEAPVVVPLSARSETALRAYAQRLLDYLAVVPADEALRIDDLAYTLQIGRKALECRAAFEVDSIADLRAALIHYLQTGEARSESELAVQWMIHSEVDWHKLYPGDKPRRISLPTYVFATERYWIETETPLAARDVIHPLLHVNTSDLKEQRYSSTFSGDELFLRDHQLRAGNAEPEKIMPGVAYLEMARAALEQAAPQAHEDGILELHDIVWVQPLVVAQERQVGIALVAKDSRIDFEVFSEDERIHCQGNASFSKDSPPPRLELSLLQDRMRRGERTADDIYAAFAEMGLEYGPSHRTIDTVWRGEGELLARLTATSQQDFVLPPGLIDGALQAAAGLLWDRVGTASGPFVPFALQTLRIAAACTGELFVWARESHEALDLDLCDQDGNVCAQLRGLALRSLGKQTYGSLLATAVWQPSPLEMAPAVDAQRHILLFDLPHIDAQELGGHCSHLQLPESGNIADAYGAFSLACFQQLQALIRSKPEQNLLLQIAMPAGEDTSIYAGIAGMLKTANLENPLVTGQLIFTPAAIGTEDLAALLRAECSQPHETLIRHEDWVRQTLGWRLIDEPAAAAFDAGGAFKEHGVYLITGGLGGLGTLFAREILERAPAARIILTGRSTLAEVQQSPERRAVLESLQSTGAVEYRQLRLDDLQDVERLIAAEQINGVIHSAGTTRDSFILKKTAEELHEVFGPKVSATVHLDLATKDVDLDFLVLFSALGCAVGNLGQADYVAANGFMDQFAARRNRLVESGQRRGRTLAIRWPFWLDGGMQLDESGRGMLRERVGIDALRTQTGLRLFYRSLASPYDQTLAMEGDLQKMQRALRAGAAAAQMATAPDESSTPGNLAQLTQDYLRRQFCTLLKLPLEKVDVGAPLEEYGIDSILALDFTRQLERTFGTLAKTLFFEYLTLRDLAGYFVKAHAARLNSLFAGAEAEPATVAAQTPVDVVASIRFSRSSAANATFEPIAIVGLSGRYPQARNVDEFWRNLRDGKDCIVEVPPERWDWREYFAEDRARPGAHFSKWGGFIDGVDEFDARFFNIAPVEAQTIDPQERLFLQHAWMAMEDAGCTRARLDQAGVYAGVMYGEYQLFGAEASMQGQRMAFASNLASIANRVSYVLNLHGPSLVVDTMCSSSLTAIHLACQDLKLGRTSVAIAGGVNVTIHPNKYLMLSAGQFISGDGHCQSFGEGGDGYIPGEGVGVVILKRLSDAQRDGNHIYGVIRGSALSHGGKTNGYTVPNPLAQAGAIRQAFQEANVDARHVSYIEAHGTGTRLGDPIEIAGLSKVFEESTADTQFCLLGSAKSNIGHCEAAAGIAGLTKVLLQLRHRQIVPSLHSSRLNPHIDFQNSPFVVSQSLQAWQQPVIDGRKLPRIAGISSFGAGGSNAHLVVEEYVQPEAQQPPSNAEHIVPLSARTAEQLQQKARELLDFITADAGVTPLSSIAYTLQAGREAMDERAAVLASSVEQLAERLQAYLDGRSETDGVHRGQVKANKETLSLLTRDADLRTTLDEWIAEGQRSKLADLWVKGLQLDWDRVHTTRPRFVSLPAYPFARQRYWVETATLARQAAKSASIEAIHPLLHRNTSDFSQRSYTAKFSGAEIFLSDDCLTPGAYLEMSRAAIEHSMPARRTASTLEMRNVAWAQPRVPVANELVTIALFDATDERLKFEICSGSDASAETVHCQGEAFYGELPAPTRLDTGALLRLPADLQESPSGFVLQPAVIASALQAAGVAEPVFVASVRVIFPCSNVMFAGVRTSSGAVDIDLCDEQGNVCVQLLGVRAQSPVAQTAAAIQEPRKIPILVSRALTHDRPALKKPNSSISLAAPGELDAQQPSPAKARVALAVAAPAIQDDTAEASAVGLLDHGGGIFEIQIDESATPDALSTALTSELLNALHTVQQQAALKVLLISGPMGGAEHANAVAAELYEPLAAFPHPVIAAMSSDAAGAGFVAAALCDFMVLSESGRYGCAEADLAARNILAERFGRAHADLTTPSTGHELRKKGWTCPIVAQDQVGAHAYSLAANLAKKSQLALRLLKQHLSRHILRAVKAGEPLAARETGSTHAERLQVINALPAQSGSEKIAIAQPTPLALRSTVVTATAHPEGILVVQMADRDAKNMFSDAFSRGLQEVFAHVEQDPSCKVVVLTGYENYFSSGGTKDALLAIHDGKARFTDNKVFQLPLSCKVPVIAAMQGHGIGAGWALGMFADFTLFSAESRYFSPYMGYGFTPGAAATLIFPHRIGYDLARETLLTAREYSGAELQERRLAHPVLARDQVVPAAMALAKVIAQRSRARLIAVKEQWTRALHQQLQETFDLELAMHERTFVGQADTLAQIRSSFAAEKIVPAASVVVVSAAAAHEDLRGITADLRGMLAHELRLPEQEIGEDEPFVDLGLDSITGVTWVRRINEKYRTAIEAIKVYSYPTLAQLSRHVREEAEKSGSLAVAAQQAAPQSAASGVATPVGAPVAGLAQATASLTSWRGQRPAKTASGDSSAHAIQPIAVIGMAGQFPGATNLATFWQNIAAGRDCVAAVPKSRWDIDLYYQEGEAAPGKTYSKWLGALEEYDLFDAAFFNISPREARSMDPQQRLFLQACWHSIENAGYDPKALAGSKCGVFVGCSSGDYHQLSRREQLSGQGFTGAAPSILAARISYFLDLQGPSLAIDTACSSSLVAIASACDSLIAGGSDLALAGGVNVMAGPAMLIMTAQVGMLSPDGRCFTFDQRANGIAAGEGVGVVMLKRLADAQRDRDFICGVVEGWGVNQDGKTNGITAPNADSQTRLQQQVYDRFHIDPASIQLIEAHGTGTALGDPIEVSGLKAAFRKYTDNKDYCALGSVKSNIGHCLTAAGVSGFIKLLLALQHKQLPPTIHFQELNRHISLDGSPFYVNTQLRQWQQNGREPRRAAINSFGFGGTNAHIVLAEHGVRDEADAVQNAPAIVPLSARTPEQLDQRARDLLAFLDARPADCRDLRRFAYTLQVGREAMNERLAFVVSTFEELSQQLRAYVDRREGGYRAQVDGNKDSLFALGSDADFRQMIEKWIGQKALPKLADLWVKGLALDWRQFHTGAQLPRRLGGLPAYPFAKDRYWIDAPTGEQTVMAAGAAAPLHPLVHANTSDLSRQKYSSAFSGEELFWAEGRLLPAVFLEMARAAIENASADRQKTTAIELQDVVWTLPADAKRLSIALAMGCAQNIEFEIFSTAGEEIVHCQGRAVVQEQPVARKLEFPVSSLTRVSLPAGQAQTAHRYQLHPGILDAALRIALADYPDSGVAIDSVSILCACNQDMFAWIRPAAADGSKLDVDLCDEHGDICVELRGVSCNEHAAVIADTVDAAAEVEVTDTTIAAASPRVDLQPAPVAATPAPSLELLQQQLQASLAEALFMKPADVNVNRSFTELGLDSIIGVEWVKVVNKQFGSELGTTRIYDYPTVKELAAYLHQCIGGTAAPQTTVATPPAAPTMAQAVEPVPGAAGISRDELYRELKASLAEALFVKPADIDINRLFTELGLDSIIGVEWVKAINKRYGSNLSAIKIYDYPNIKALAAFLIEAMAAAAAPQPVRSEAPSEQPTQQPAARVQAIPPRSRVRLSRTGGIRFEPKYGKRFRELYFHTSNCEGDFEAEGEIAVTCAISPESNVCLQEHVVFNEHLLPTDAYIELVHGAYRTYFSNGNVTFNNLSIVNPLLGARGRNTYLKVVFRRHESGLQFFVRSSASPRFEHEKVHVQGFIATSVQTSARASGGDFTILKELSSTEIPTNAGTYYAPLQQLQFGESAARGHIQVRPSEFKFLANPFVLYGGLCTVINYGAWLVARHHGASDDQFLPHRIERIALPGTIDAGVYLCHAQIRTMQRDVVELDFQIVDEANQPVAIVEGISLRRVARRTIQQQVALAHAVAPMEIGADRPPEQVAIIGMSCRYPMGESIDAFWSSLKAGRDCITEVPAGRWDDYPDWYHPDPHHAHTSYSKWGGFLERIDTFDSLFFGISPAEAELIDPQQRVFMEECWKTIESAGYAPGALSHQPCGVYVGCATSDYTRVLADEGRGTVGAAFMGTSNAILAARISYFLNLKGPALAIDTACSSSLVAVHLACESIRSGETQWALAGGINLLATPLGHILTSQVGMPSRDGRCSAFDAAANGIVFSEGCGVLLLKALSRARLDGDTILGVIQASGVNQDGKTNGITAPSANAQEQLLQQIYGKFAIDPRRISYIEAHGTATPLGDPIEVNALTSVFQKRSADQAYCALGSVKSNIGHTGFAAGVAGIIKVLLCMKHGKLVPSIHYATANPHIDFDSSPFFVNTEYRDWTSAGPRLAAVSSFGFSGTNAHVVIEQDPAALIEAAPAAAPDGKVIVPLSARAAEQLQQKAVDLLHFIRNAEQPIDLARLAYTLQVGRDAMDARVGFIVGSLAELAAKLQDYVDGKAGIEGVHRAVATGDSDTLALFAADEAIRNVIDQWLTSQNLSKVVELWVRGLDVDWNRLYQSSRPRRMALPAYPFARQRCWVEKAAAEKRPRGATALAQLHPLVHANTSDLEQQSFSSTFSGDEFFLTDHRVNGQKVLPAVAYLEMAHAAVRNSLPVQDASAHLELRHIVFAQPLVVTRARQISIAVFAEESDQIHFQVHSQAGDGTDDVLHSQGHCALVGSPGELTLDLRQLEKAMTRGTLAAGELYPAFARLGLAYGPAFQGITALHQGEQQLLVELRLPEAAQAGGEEYLLHPSLMDSALQGSITMIGDLMRSSGKPSLPFALESLHILAPCAREMVAWLRYSAGARGSSANLLKVDIDLCDRDGKVCVQMRGFSSRSMENEAAFDEAHYLSVIAGVLSNKISAEEAVELG